MFHIIPVLKVEQSSEWCEPQKCFSASVWWGEVLLSFYSTDESRLEPNRLNEEACKVLQEITNGVLPDSEEVIAPDELLELMHDTILCCYWDDFIPVVSMYHRNRCVIATEKAEKETSCPT